MECNQIFNILFTSFKFQRTLKKIVKFTEVNNLSHHLADIYLLKVKTRNIRTRCEICSKLTIKIPE